MGLLRPDFIHPTAKIFTVVDGDAALFVDKQTQIPGSALLFKADIPQLQAHFCHDRLCRGGDSVNSIWFFDVAKTVSFLSFLSR